MCKFLAPDNNNRRGPKRLSNEALGTVLRIDMYRMSCQMRFQQPTTLAQAKSIARHLGLTLRQVRSGDYRVNCRDGNEATAYYTDNLGDAIMLRLG